MVNPSENLETECIFQYLFQKKDNEEKGEEVLDKICHEQPLSMGNAFMYNLRLNSVLIIVILMRSFKVAIKISQVQFCLLTIRRDNLET